MAVLQQRVCDSGHLDEAHPPTQMVMASIGDTQFAGEFCDEAAAEVERAFIALGLRPTKAQVGHTRRGAYITASGRTFTTNEARIWLKTAGHKVADAGKLTNDQLMMFAQTH